MDRMDSASSLMSGEKIDQRQAELEALLEMELELRNLTTLLEQQEALKSIKHITEDAMANKCAMAYVFAFVYV